MEEPAIRVSDVSKVFKLPKEKQSSIKSRLVNIFNSKKGYELQKALKDISFEVQKGEFFGIVGRNGSGKSTLLKIIASIYQPTSGGVGVSGKLVPFIELGVGFNPELTGRENVYLNGALMGFSEKEVDVMYKDIVDFAELGRFMDQKLKNYSSGMQVRLAFSMAVRSEADVLLIDEVLAVGDAAFQRKCFDYFRTLKLNKKTVVFVSHDMEAIREFCDRALLMENNKVQIIGNPSEVATMYYKLFTNKTAANIAQGNRWGTGKVKIEKLHIKKNILTEDIRELELSTELRGYQNNEYLMNGIRIRNASGQILQETNTWVEGIKLPNLKPKERCVINWVYPNIYNDGIYIIDTYAYGKDNEVFESWDNAANFEVRRDGRASSLVRIVPKIEVKNG